MHIAFHGNMDWSVHIYRWANALRRRGHSATLASAAWVAADVEDGVRWFSMAPRHLAGIPKVRGLFRPTLAQMVQRVKPDVLQVFRTVTPGVEGVARRTSVPIVITAFGSEILVTPQRSRAERRANQRNLRVADCITCDSRHVADVIAEDYSPKCPVEVVQWGVDPSQFSPAADTQRARAAVGRESSALILSTRSWRPLYNIDTIVAAAPTVHEAAPGATFLLKGTWSEDSVGVPEMVARSRCEGYVSLAGEVPYGEMAGFYALADVFVSVPSSDSSAVSLHEAMACGCTPVVSDLPANREWVQDGVNGRIVPVRDPKALAGAIIDVLRDDAFRARCRELNLAIVSERCDHEKEMSRMERIYFDLVEGNRNRGNW